MLDNNGLIEGFLVFIQRQPATSTSFQPPAAVVLEPGLDRQPLDFLRQGDIARRNAAGVVCGQRERQSRMADVDVGMMVHRLRDISDASHERDRAREGWKAIRLRERVPAARPSGKSAELTLD